MLDPGFLGDAGLPDIIRRGSQRLRFLRHRAIGENVDFMRVLGGLVVSIGIFVGVGAGFGEQPAGVVVDDARAERGQRRLQRRERLFRGLRGALLVAAKQLVDVEARQQQLLDGFAAHDHVVRITCLGRQCLQLFEHGERLRADRIERLPGQLVLLLLQHDELVEIPGVLLELLVDIGHPGATFGISDLIESLLDAFGERLLALAGFGDQIFVARQ